jgi:hypothetical protein
MEPSAQTRATACDVTGTVNSIDCEIDAPAARRGCQGAAADGARSVPSRAHAAIRAIRRVYGHVLVAGERRYYES